MRVKEKLLLVHNLLLMQVKSREDLYDAAGELRRYIVGCDFYPTGPFVYITKEDGSLQIGVPISERVEIKEDQPFEFMEELYIEKCACVRCEEDEVQKGYEVLGQNLKEKDKNAVSTFYHVVLNVYGEVFTDIYVTME